ncbi:MAG: hypothetical protein H6R19_2914 [Proteobacteria bacterium]|nr:hypothetical protein [Pseudomonadota bacterium]
MKTDFLQGDGLVALKRAAAYLDLEPQTIRNKMWRGEWPLPVARQGSRVYFFENDLRHYAASLRGKQRPRRGAPTAAERQAAAKAGISVPAWRSQQGGQP